MAGGDRIRDLINLFGPHAEAAEPEPMCWIADGDSGTDYCRACCDKAVAKARRSGYRDASLDGGYDDTRSSDGSAACGTCGRLLGYTLSRAGLAQELAYWEGSSDAEPLTSVHAYEIRAVLSAASSFGDDADVAAAIAMGEAMAPLLPASTATAGQRPVPVP